MIPVGPVIARVRVALERAKVWELITTESGRRDWLPGFSIGEGLGSDVIYRGDDRELTGTVDVWVAGHVIGWKWSRTDEGKETAPLITLRSQEHGTTVTITETGFDVLGSGVDHARNAQEGWGTVLAALTEHAGVAEDAARGEDAAALSDVTPEAESALETEPEDIEPEPATESEPEPEAEGEPELVAVSEPELDEAREAEVEPEQDDTSEPETDTNDYESEYDFDSDDGGIEGEIEDELEPLMEPKRHTNTGVIAIPAGDTDADDEELGEASDTEAAADAEGDEDAESDDTVSSTSEIGTDHAEPAEESVEAPETEEPEAAEPASNDAVILPEPPKDWEEQRDPSIYTANVPTVDSDASDDGSESEESGDELDNDAAFSQLLRDATVEPQNQHDPSHGAPETEQGGKRPWWRRR